MAAIYGPTFDNPANNGENAIRPMTAEGVLRQSDISLSALIAWNHADIRDTGKSILYSEKEAITVS